MPRVGVLCVAPGCPVFPIEVAAGTRAFVETLRELGYDDRKNLELDLRGVGERRDQLPALATTLLRRGVDVILAVRHGPALAAARATRTIPIVMVGVENAVELGLVASLGRPGGNVTGVSVPWDRVGVKQLQLLRETAPAVSRVALFWNPESRADRLTIHHIERAARELGMEALSLEARGPGDVEGALSLVAQRRANALVVLEDPAFVIRRGQIVQFALQNRLPAIASNPDFVAAGGLLSFAPSGPDSFRRAAGFVAKILKGAKPADLPVEEPVRYEIVVNLPTAKALGLTVPQSILVQAERVIE